MPPVVVLVGVPGSGKSTVGRILAARLGLGFRDTDVDIEEEHGRSIPDIFVQDGESTFRAWERDAVGRALDEHEGVLSLGGGAVLDPATRERLRAHRTVWLKVSPAAGASRVGLDAPRPVLLGNVRGRLTQLLAERTPWYEEVSDDTVDTDDLKPEAVADRIEAFLGAEGRT